MKTITRPLAANPKATREEYLGFQIRSCADAYYAAPTRGSWGKVLRGDTKASLRKKIWCWWFQVQ